MSCPRSNLLNKRIIDPDCEKIAMTKPESADHGKPFVRFEKRTPHIAVVTLDRPAQRNAINGEMARLIESYVEAVEADKDIRVAILTAEGDKSFCAGADLGEVAAGRGQTLVTEKGGFAGFVYAPRIKPWIAAVGSAAMGGGLEMSLACDMIVAGESASFGLPEPKRGIIAGAGGIYRLARAIPRAIAMEMLATGAPISARRGYELGLVNRVVPDAEVLNEALALAAQIIACAPGSVRESLMIARVAIDRSENELRGLTLEAARRVMSPEDAKEGPRAFMEKRAPQWHG